MDAFTHAVLLLLRGLHPSPVVQVTVKNYRKFKVLETLTAEADVSGSSNNSNSSNSKGSCSDDALVGVGGSSLSLSTTSSSSWSTGLMRTRKTLRPEPAEAEPANSAGARSMPMPMPMAAAAAVNAPSSASSLSSAAATAATTVIGGGGREDQAGDTGAGTAPPSCKAEPAAGPPALITAKEMAAMKDPSAFHEALTLPFTGDASVEAYFQRIDGIMSKDVASVRLIPCRDAGRGRGKLGGVGRAVRGGRMQEAIVRMGEGAGEQAVSIAAFIVSLIHVFVTFCCTSFPFLESISLSVVRFRSTRTLRPPQGHVSLVF